MVRQAVAATERDTGLRLDDGQRRLAHTFCTDDRRIVAAVGPAAPAIPPPCRPPANGWAAAGRWVIQLATSAQAAGLLAHDLGRRADNLHKYTHELTRPNQPPGPSRDPFFRLDRGDVLLVDEA